MKKIINRTNAFGENLKRLRFSMGFTQSDVSKRADLSQSAITQLEKGHKDPTLQTILKLAKALNVPAFIVIALN